jgi:predicted ATP-dependent endonuclease of OLD family
VREPGDRPSPGEPALRSPAPLRKRFTELARDRARCAREKEAAEKKLRAVRAKLDLAPRVEAALEGLSRKLLERMVKLLEEKLSIALQEVLEQPLRLKAVQSFERGAASVRFHVERNGAEEDILRGQGGSVANVLSVGLRMFALTSLDPKAHRRFLLLDEPDCWLQPDLVPRLVKIIRDAGKALGFQVILVSHHGLRSFEDHADRIYRFTPQPDGSVGVALWERSPSAVDG